MMQPEATLGARIGQLSSVPAIERPSPEEISGRVAQAIVDDHQKAKADFNAEFYENLYEAMGDFGVGLLYQDHIQPDEESIAFTLLAREIKLNGQAMPFWQYLFENTPSEHQSRLADCFAQLQKGLLVNHSLSDSAKGLQIPRLRELLVEGRPNVFNKAERPLAEALIEYAEKDKANLVAAANKVEAKVVIFSTTGFAEGVSTNEALPSSGRHILAERNSASEKQQDAVLCNRAPVVAHGANKALVAYVNKRAKGDIYYTGLNERLGGHHKFIKVELADALIKATTKPDNDGGLALAALINKSDIYKDALSHGKLGKIYRKIIVQHPELKMDALERRRFCSDTFAAIGGADPTAITEQRAKGTPGLGLRF